MSRERGDAHVQQAGSLGPWDVWSILLSCPPRACYWLPAAGLLHQLTAMGATGSPGASELTKSHLVTARHQRETTEPSWRRRCPWWHVGSLPVAEGNKCAQAELHHRCQNAAQPQKRLCSLLPRSGVPAEPGPGLGLLQGVFVCTHSDLVNAVS